MSEPLIAPGAAPSPPVPAARGFCGKLPARGDFVSAGLPRRFVDPWHDWMQRMLAASREMLADRWTAAWLEAPVWRFALSPGLCGPDAAIGLWMPSVDRVGRYFPLTFALLSPRLEPAEPIASRGDFLAAAEAAGRDALASDLAPDEVANRILETWPDPPDADAEPAACPAGGSLWWSDGSARVPSATMACASLPDEPLFVSMIDGGALAAPAACGEP